MSEPDLLKTDQHVHFWNPKILQANEMWILRNITEVSAFQKFYSHNSKASAKSQSYWSKWYSHLSKLFHVTISVSIENVMRKYHRQHIENTSNSDCHFNTLLLQKITKVIELFDAITLAYYFPIAINKFS